jgi:hypothetical protein
MEVPRGASACVRRKPIRLDHEHRLRAKSKKRHGVVQRTHEALLLSNAHGAAQAGRLARGRRPGSRLFSLQRLAQALRLCNLRTTGSEETRHNMHSAGDAPAHGHRRRSTRRAFARQAASFGLPR